MSLYRRVADRVRSQLEGRPPVLGAPPDLEPAFLQLYSRAAPFTMTSIERMYALWQATRYVSARGLAGDLVECGVWRGGSSLMLALTLMELQDTARTLTLFDTFEGMPPPGDRDVTFAGEPAIELLARTPRAEGASNVWAVAGLDDVKATMALSAYPRIEYVQGKVENTLPGSAPEEIALLRLDTDWYDSTRHELEHLYPRLARGGVLIIDDYGHYRGAREAVDEFFSGRRPTLLNRIDYSGRLIIKDEA